MIYSKTTVCITACCEDDLQWYDNKELKPQSKAVYNVSKVYFIYGVLIQNLNQREKSVCYSVKIDAFFNACFPEQLAKAYELQKCYIRVDLAF